MVKLAAYDHEFRIEFDEKRLWWGVEECDHFGTRLKFTLHDDRHGAWEWVRIRCERLADLEDKFLTEDIEA